jgi:hypothetical protein
MPAGIIGQKRDFDVLLTQGLKRFDCPGKRMIPTVEYPIHVHHHMLYHLRAALPIL